MSGSALEVLADVPADDQVHVVDVPTLGSYRVQAREFDSVTVVSGLPTAAIGDTLRLLVGWEVLLSLVGTSLAALLGWVLVRRQLRPLRQVADTAHGVTQIPLSSGAVSQMTRVPVALTDPQTEVGQVGSALNSLLGHVEDALAARHDSEQRVRQFVADASHELRTPLATIAGYAELSRRTAEPSTGSLTQALAKVESEASRMTSLVDDMLLLARLDAGRPLHVADVDVTRLVLEAVGDARIVGADHDWRLDLPADPVEVSGDHQRLHQVVTNVLNNARRHTPAGTTVTVTVTEEPGSAVVTVHDNGPGIAPELRTTMFERFARGDSSRTRASGGTGLGLSIVSAIVAAHGGTVDVRSTPGDTSFSVCLPR